MDTKPVITIELLNRLKSERGGYTRATLEFLGVGWPPKRGWRKALIREARANQIKVATSPEAETTTSNLDHGSVIHGRMLLLSPEQRLELFRDIRKTYCEICGRMKASCEHDQ